MYLNSKIKFQWVLSGTCNYRCPYCWHNGIWAKLKRETVYLAVNEWMDAWNDIYDKYGSVEISISGGEPFLYPNFINLINGLSKQHMIGIVTNLSFDAELFVSEVKSRNIHLSVSFHPLFIKFEEFLKKALILKDNGLLDGVFYVTYPPQLKQMQFYKNKFEQRGFSFIIQPFWGKYQGRSYPESYSEDEKKIITLLLGNQEQIEYRLNQRVTSGKLCLAGQIHAVIEPNGLVKRCGFSSEGPIGNFLDKNFKLFDSPLPCASTYCPCNDYVYLVEESQNKQQLLSLKKKTKVAVALCPGWGRGNPPYVLVLFCGILRQQSYSVYAFDINNKLYHSACEKEKLLWRWEESLFWQRELSVGKYISEHIDHINNIINEIIESGVKIVCFPVYSTTKLMSIDIARRIKTRGHDICIIFGGTECKRSLNWRQIIEQDCVDILIFEEGEQVLPEVIGMVAEGKDLSRCKGIAYKANGEIIDCGDRTRLDNLDDLPFADFSDFDFNLYESHNPAVIPILTTRGCTEHCVYCSTKHTTEGFLTMSGKRIFDEIMHQINSYKQGAGVDQPVFLFFLDLLINAKTEILEEWVNLLAEEKRKNKSLADLRWYAQIILSKELTPALLEKIKSAGCVLLNYGIESGSARVLKDMGKRLSIDAMEKAIKDIHEAGIPARGNFMVGFPTETEENFQETLDFVKRNGKYITEIYPSRTFCALEAFSILDKHREKFGITVPSVGGDNLFWESQNGANNYLVRMDRYNRFCELLNSMPHKPLVTGIADIKRDNCLSLGDYYRFNKEYKKAIDNYKEYLSLGGTDNNVWENIKLCEKDNSLNIIDENTLLNRKEYFEKKIILKSTPPTVYFQIDGPCNQDCIFCSRPREYSYFNLREYYNNLGKKLHPILSRANAICLTGAGEFLLLPEAEEILSYFNNEFPRASKIFATNGSTLTPKIADLIKNSKNRYEINISFPASNAELYKKLTNSDNFDKVMQNLEYLCHLHHQSLDFCVFFMFLVTTTNIEDLPNIIRLAAKLKPDGIYCEYVSIYRLEQRRLSCFFKQELTNSVFKEAEVIAKDLKVNLRLPWHFMQDNYPEVDCCQPWTQIMINSKGEILPCCLFGDFKETLGKRDFWEIWNGEVYQKIRKCLLKEATGYCDVCLRKKPNTVNDFSSHIITREISKDEIAAVVEKELKLISNSDDKKIKLPPPHKVFLNWDIHYSCNYRCSYCFFQGKWEEVFRGNVYPGIQPWVDIWRRFYDKYGECEIDISGGEPTTYPDFFELISQISQMHRIRFNTNLSFDTSELFEKINLSQKAKGWDRIKVNSSFHPEYASLGNFLDKLTIVKDTGFKAIVTYVAYPPHLKQMYDVKQIFIKKGIDFVIQPFRGKYQGLSYPDAYTDEEKEILNICSPGNPEGLFTHHLGEKKDKEKRLCRMGQVYAKIYPNGEAHRCCAEGVGRIGNIINDKDFTLLSEPTYCDVSCPCWKAMIVDKEPVWLHYWK